MYTVDYFINKFEAIPKSKWLLHAQGIEEIEGKHPHCAIGWCRNDMGFYGFACIRSSNEAHHFFILLTEAGIKSILQDNDDGGFVIAEINNGTHPDYQQSTPKQRILAALYDIKKMQQPVYTDIRKNLAILPVDKIETDLPVKELIKESEVSDETWD